MSRLPSVGVGLDVGSTTVKAVGVVDGRIAFRAYERHRGQVFELANVVLTRAREVARTGPLVVTGSAGATVAERVGGAFVHEVHAIATAAKAAVPGVKTVIELGGQDAKLVHLDRAAVTSEMNERCAAGTGTVIDRCAHRLGLDEATLRALERRGPLPTVSARCGVFAETDVVGLVKAGHPAEVAMLALLDAVVRQNLVSLARGQPLDGPVCLLGGPNAFLPALAALWREHLRSHWARHSRGHGEVVVPADAPLFGALGALASASEFVRLRKPRGARASTATATTLELGRPARPADDELVSFAPRAEPRGVLGGTVTVGLDAGSTTVKAVALDEHAAVVASAYRRAGSSVFADASAVLRELDVALNGRAIDALGVTGYAAELLAPVLGADLSVVETLAHARSARRYVPDADVVCDIGGQDIKVLMLDEQGVRDFRLSQQCAAGNGALLEATGAALGVPLERLSQLTTNATRAPRFSVGCAVFLDTERVTAQRDGSSPAEILAGMTDALCRNVWENVVAAASLEALGDVFVLSGGVQRNEAAVRAQARYLHERHPRARVVVHPYPGEAGAIGAALAAREAHSSPASRRSLAELARVEVTTENDESTRCTSCASRCARTVAFAVRGDLERTHVTGHGCERGAVLPTARASFAAEVGRVGRSPGPKRGLNLARLEATCLFQPQRRVEVVSSVASGLRVAMPRVLAQYRAAPLFTHYLEALGVSRNDLVVSDLTTESLWHDHAGRGTADPCFPAKLAQAHVASLLAHHREQPFDVLFFPAVTHAVTSIRGCADTASCPVVAGTPWVTRASFEADEGGRLPNGVQVLTPALVLPRRAELSHGLFEAWRAVLPRLTRDEHEAALAEAIAAQRAWDRLLEEWGTKAIRESTETGRCAIVLIGRPYHADPGLHHELGSELASLGRSSMTLRALPHSPDLLESVGCASPHDLSDLPFLTNSGDGERLAAARLVGQHPFLVAIELSHFKCGQDASLYAHVAEAARGPEGKPFLALHDLDESRPVASLRLRIRTFLSAVEAWERRQRVPRAVSA